MARQAEIIKESILEAAYANAKKLGTQLVDRALYGSDSAMKELLERTLGRVKEDITLNAKIENTITIPDDRFNQIIQLRAKRIANTPLDQNTY